MNQTTTTIIAAVAGALGMGIIVFLIYRFRDRLAALRGGVSSRVGAIQSNVSRGQQERYREAAIEQANRWHLAGHLVPLEQVSVAPRFLPMPRPFNPYDEADTDEIDGPFGLVPFTAEYPQIAGIYPLPGIDVLEVLSGVSTVALLGAPGSGRSTALALMAALVARQALVGQEMLIPALFHLGDVDFSPETLQGNVDPAAIMASAVQQRLSGQAARIAGNLLPSVMAAGECLVLADGWDELPAPQRARTLAWLRVLMDTYPRNRYIVAGPARDYKPLRDSGLRPVNILPWTDGDFAELARRWAEAWSMMAGSRRERGNPPDPDLVRRVARGNRARNPLDVTLKVWAAYAGDEQSGDRQAWYSAYVDHLLPAPQARQALQRLAVEAIKPDPVGMLGRPEDEARGFLDAALAGGGLSMDTADVLREIVDKAPLLVRRAGGRYAFVHPLVGGFLAAEALAESNLDVLRDADHALEVTGPFLAAMGDVSELVDERLSAEPEVHYDHLLSAAPWAADAPPDAPWRVRLFSRLEEILLAPSQYPVLRERALAALVASRSAEIIDIFRRTARTQDPLSRMLAVLGLGAVGSPELLPDIIDMLADVAPGVQIAAALALGAIGGQAAVEHMVDLLFDGSELVRQAVAETLASDEQTGHGLLRDAINEKDVLVRRAAVFGLARVGQPWAVEVLQERQTGDDQWFVRDAAHDALEGLAVGSDRRSPKPFPLPERMEWLLDWAADHGAGVPSGPRAVETLIHALQAGSDDVRYAAADTLGKLGGLEAVPPLYAALRDPVALVRETAYRALASVSQSTGQSLPAVL